MTDQIISELENAAGVIMVRLIELFEKLVSMNLFLGTPKCCHK